MTARMFPLSAHEGGRWQGVTRRRLLRGAGGAAALAVTGGGVFELLGWRSSPPMIRSFAVKPADPVRAFRSRPDLRPPTVTAPAGRGAGWLPSGDWSRFLFLAPGPVSLTGSQQYGPLIVDHRGEPVWFRPLAPGIEVTNFASSRYRGEPVLVWWEGNILTSGYGQGEGVIVDRSYREVARVRAAGGRSMDLHALVLTPEGTALFTCYPDTVSLDLSSIGGPRRGQALESIIQEVDIASGRLLFEWRSLQHVAVGDSFQPLAEPHDYLHANSIALTQDGNLLVSGRHTWALYKLDRRSGAVIWRLGGKRSDFRVARDAQFAWQHDAQQISARALTLFDNASNGLSQSERQSRGLVLHLDQARMTVTLGNAYTQPRPLVATSMGSTQLLPSGRVAVGWGTASHTSEFASDGRLLSDVRLPQGTYSYRGLLLPWRSAPHHRPAIAAGRDGDSGSKLLYASWNGATQIAAWRVDSGASADRLQPTGIAPRRGFETVIPLHPRLRFAAVTALDSTGRRLGHSHAVRL